MHTYMQVKDLVTVFKLNRQASVVEGRIFRSTKIRF